jgi:hypothetical protein
MAQLSLFSNTKKKNTMAVKKTKAQIAAAKIKKEKAGLAKIKKEAITIEKKIKKARLTIAELRQTGSSNTAADKRRKAERPGKRVSKSGNVYYEYRANRSDKSKATRL